MFSALPDLAQSPRVRSRWTVPTLMDCDSGVISRVRVYERSLLQWLRRVWSVSLAERLVSD